MTKFQKKKHQTTTRKKKEKSIVNWTECETTVRAVHLHWHDVLNVPLTFLLHCPISSMTRTLSFSAKIELVITNRVREFCYSVDQNTNREDRFFLMSPFSIVSSETIRGMPSRKIQNMLLMLLISEALKIRKFSQSRIIFLERAAIHHTAIQYSAIHRSSHKSFSSLREQAFLR